MGDQEKDFLEDAEIEEDVQPTKSKKQLSEQKKLPKITTPGKHTS